MRYVAKFLKFACLAGWAVGSTLAADAPDDVCQATACRDGNAGVMLGIKGYAMFMFQVDRSPYVQPDGSLLIYPGETLVFHADEIADGLGTLRFVAAYAPELPVLQLTPIGKSEAPPALPPLPDGKEPQDVLAQFPAGSVIISFGPTPDRDGMYLSVMHNLPHPIKFDAVMTVPDADPQATSTCPVTPGVMLLESWPHPMGPITLSGVRFLADDAKMVCE